MILPLKNSTLISMCFVLPWNIRLSTNVIALLLSHHSIDFLYNITLISNKSDCSDVTSIAPFDKALYLALVLDGDTTLYSFELYHMRLLVKKCNSLYRTSVILICCPVIIYISWYPHLSPRCVTIICSPLSVP